MRGTGERPAAAAWSRARMRAEVRAGLARAQKELPSKYFYDARGARLFEEITQLPEYYLTRAERALLEAWAPSLAAGGRYRALVELGAGSAEKTRVLLKALLAAAGGGEPGGGGGERAAEGEPAGTDPRPSAPVADGPVDAVTPGDRGGGIAAGGAGGLAAAGAAGRVVYVPVDASPAYLEQASERLRAQYPALAVWPVAADLGESLALPADLPRPALFAFLGSTIGNFDGVAAAALLSRVRAAMGEADRLLLGVDLKKDVARLEAAYNDARGVTAEFNRNLLRVLNRELGADFDPEAFEHRAFYAAGAGRIEMHLVARAAQEVRIPGVGVVRFEPGESVRTEISCKYDRADVQALFAGASLALAEWRADAGGLFALALAAPG